MPHVQITLLKGRTAEQKRRMAARIADVVAEEGKTARTGVVITFVDVDSDSYSVGGVLVSDTQKQTIKT